MQRVLFQKAVRQIFFQNCDELNFQQTFEKLQKVALDSESIGHEVLAGHLSQCLKMHLFGAGDKNFK